MHVGRQMMYNCILGILKGKTRIVILNSHLHFLPLFDKIIVVNNRTAALKAGADPTQHSTAGFIEAVGTYQELLKTHKDLMRADEGHDALADEKASVPSLHRNPLPPSVAPCALRSSSLRMLWCGRCSEGDKHRAKTEAQAAEQAKAVAAAGGATAVQAAQDAKDDAQRKTAKKLIDDEDRVAGAVGGNVYLKYFVRRSLLTLLLLHLCTA
jgi:hypothetical protein